MNRLRRQLLNATLALASALTLSAPLAAQTALKEFTPINPPARTLPDAGKIEVTLFFSYGCPSCANYSDPFTAWAARQGSDVVVKKVPLSFNAYFAALAPIYYTLETMGELARLDSVVYRTIHGGGNRLGDAKSRADWAKRNGLDANRFEQIYKSFAIDSQVRSGNQRAVEFRVEGVPSLAIGGRYMVNNQLPPETQLAIADKLISQLRSERSSRK